jgi:general secretion pathway protein A
MYKAFYQLQRNPFEITPNPFFLFRTRLHNEALASLYYGVRMHKGFVVMTGEVGTGKTLLIRCLLTVLSRCAVSFANVFNPRLSPLEFIRYIAADLGLEVSGKAKDQLLFDLNAYLVERQRKKLTTLLVVDEAHNVSEEVLEEIRLLTNLETAQQKILQILLVGQPELDQKLDSIDLRQLKQRISLRCHLEPLDAEETKAYIRRRLQLAGANSQVDTIFPDVTAASVYRHSGGIPRVINTICENALTIGYARQARMVTPDVIEEVAVDFRLGIVLPPGEDRISSGNGNELRRAVRTVLELHDYLQGFRSKKTESAIALTEGSSGS